MSPAGERRRLFFALWPDAAVRTALGAVGGKRLRRVKRVPADNLHLTLAFAGPVTRTVQDCLEARAGDVQAAPFDLLIDHAGYWPGPRICWIGPAHVPPGLWSLAGALRAALVSCGLEAETRPWLPHITLARKVNPGLDVGDFAPVPWTVRQFMLVESVTDQAGARYSPIRSWTLEGVATSV